MTIQDFVEPEWFDNAEQPLISIIMQSYLKDYPGSRSEPGDKFIRAVNSFKDQVYTNNELIIVADGCKITLELYDKHYKDDPTIRLIYVSRNTGEQSTYETVGDDKKYFRGYPRQIGVDAATGDLISYMDSDDVMLPHHTQSISIEYDLYPEFAWFANRAWIDNSKSITFKDDDYREDTGESFKIPGLDEEWVEVRATSGRIIRCPWAFTHVATDKVKWRDIISTTTGGGGYLGEDADFIDRFIAEYTTGLVLDRPTYVRCHHVPVPENEMPGWDC